TMEQMFAGFAPHGKPAGPVGAGLESSLYGFADSQVFLLHPRAHSHALLVVIAARLADIGEIEIENHAAMVSVDGQREVCVHVAFVAVDHQVGVLPEVPGAVALASRSRR